MKQLKTKSKLKRIDNRVGLLFILPATLLAVIFVYLPAGIALVAGFFHVPINRNNPPTWVGLDNFETVFLEDSDIQQAIFNTFYYSLLTVIPTIIIGLALALLVDSLPGKQQLISTLLFLPLTANMVAMAVTFRWIFSPNGGFINSLLMVIGIAPINFIDDPNLAMPVVAALGIWRSASFAMVLFMAGLTTIPSTVHEAAKMDGLRGWAKVRKITLPLLKPSLVLVSVISVIQAVQVFDHIHVMTQGGPQGATETILTMIWRLGFSYFKLGEASALTLVFLAVLILLGWFQRKNLIGGQR